jgi:CheY-like chemotaxis protein
MSQEAELLIVDDDALLREIYQAALEQRCRLRFASNGREALAAVEQSRPDLILLDVHMPEMDGYEACRRLKQSQAKSIPVMFVSGRDQIEDRMSGYDAGGYDYLVKPFDPAELLAKVDNILRLTSQQSRLQEMAENANRTALTAMTYLGEMGVLIEALRGFNACHDLSAVADTILAAVSRYGLHAVAQLRMAGQTLTRSTTNEASPLVASLISRTLGARGIAQVKSRLSITYERVSLLISDMPADAEERSGRLRDLLAILAEAADVRVDAIAARAAS